MQGSWAVEYRDGSTLAQFQDHPQAISGEVPYRAIDWSQVERVIFESPLARSVVTIPAAHDGMRWSLRSRHIQNMHGDSAMFFMLVQSVVDQEVNDDSVKYVLYWAPNGIIHESPLFNSPDIYRYGLNQVHGLSGALMPAHDTLQLAADATIIP